MHAVSTNQIADIFHFKDKVFILREYDFSWEI